LPLLIGWFSLNVPSGLGVYWIINNFVSTATSVFIRNQLAPATANISSSSSSGSSSSSSVNGSSNIQDAEIKSVSQSTSFEEAKGFGTPSQSISDSEIDGEIIAGNDR
jgi:YidC/Oxa1 family membrane protein insertase